MVGYRTYKSTNTNNEVNILLLLLLCTHSKFISLSIYQFCVIQTAILPLARATGNCFALHNVCNDFCFLFSWSFLFLDLVFELNVYVCVCVLEKEDVETELQYHFVWCFLYIYVLLCYVKTRVNRSLYQIHRNRFRKSKQLSRRLE